MVEKEYNDLRELLVIASACKKPDQMQLGKLLETSGHFTQVVERQIQYPASVQ